MSFILRSGILYIRDVAEDAYRIWLHQQRYPRFGKQDAMLRSGSALTPNPLSQNWERGLLYPILVDTPRLLGNIFVNGDFIPPLVIE
jgi:hypothetical protein